MLWMEESNRQPGYAYYIYLIKLVFVTNTSIIFFTLSIFMNFTLKIMLSSKFLYLWNKMKLLCMLHYKFHEKFAVKNFYIDAKFSYVFYTIFPWGRKNILFSLHFSYFIHYSLNVLFLISILKRNASINKKNRGSI